MQAKSALKAADDDLATERDTEAPATELGPEALLGECWVVAQVVRLGGELELALAGLAVLIGRRPGDLHAPSSGPGVALDAQDL